MTDDPKTPRELRDALEPEPPYFPPNQKVWLGVWRTGIRQARDRIRAGRVEDAAQWLDAVLDAIDTLLPPPPAKSPTGDDSCQEKPLPPQ